MRTPSRDILSVAATAAISACALTYYIMINQRRKQKEDPKHDNSSQIAACTATRTTSCDAVAVPLVGLGEAHPASLLPENRQCVYLDYNATTPVFPEVTNVIIPFITTCFGNPSSPHVYAAVCRRAIELSRDQVGRLINAPNPHKTIYFTSCGSESDNRAIDIALHHYHKRRTPTPRIITCAVEHPAVLLYLKRLQDQGTIDLKILGVNSEGAVKASDVRDNLTENTALVTIMHSNNEVGTIQPIKEISRHVHTFNTSKRSDVLLHTDAAQSLGKVCVDVRSLGVDMATIVGHKFGCPKGVAALYMREGIHWCPMLIGGGQEHGLRAGTENVAFIAALGEASRLAYEEANELLLHMLTLKQRLIAGLKGIFNEESPSSSSASSPSSSSFMRFNGPVRSNDESAIASDLKIMRIMMSATGRINNKDKSHLDQNKGKDKGHSEVEGKDQGKDKDKDKGSDKHNDKDHDKDKNKGGESNGDNGKDDHMQLSSKCLVDQLPNTVSVSFRHVAVSSLMPLLQPFVACSAGSACHSEVRTMSPVLEAMGVPSEYGLGTLRLSWGRHTTVDEIDRAVRAIGDVVCNARRK